MKFHCIADEDTVRGFRLAGVSGQVATTPAAAAAALQAAAAQPDCGVVVLTEATAGLIRPQVEQFRFERDQPLLVVIPGPGGPAAERKSLRQFVQEAVGIRLEPATEN